VFAALAAGPAFAGHTESVAVYAPPGGARAGEPVKGQRTWLLATSASEDEACALHKRLIEAGARSVNLFLPHNVLVCEIPLGGDFGELLQAPGFQRIDESVVGPSLASGTGYPIGWIREAYRGAQRQIDQGGSAGTTAADPGFHDLLFTPSPEKVQEIQRALKEYGPSEFSDPDRAALREVTQNSEFLAGSILAQFIYPESDGGSETWTDADIVKAEQGAALAMLSLQGRWPAMDIHVIFEMRERMRTIYEPIEHNSSTDARWIVDTVHRMYPEFSDLPEPLSLVHAMNTARRDARGTDWVVTSFIARAKNAPQHRFRDADYTAYAHLGGPFMVTPYPAGLDPNQVGEDLVYSQIVQHEVGHLFWALDEYPSGPGTCANQSGYLNVPNGNKTELIQGQEFRCNREVACIMHSSGRFDEGRPFCGWTQGQFGVSDSNNNSIPDIFESRPVVVFEVAGPETVLTNHVSLRIKAKSTPVENNNPWQSEPRTDYAARLRDGFFSLGGSSIRVHLRALDGRWDEVEEDCRVELDLASVGRTSLFFELENQAGYESNPTRKDIFYVGVNFNQLSVVAAPGRFTLTWQVVGSDFDAKYAVYRLKGGESKPGRLVADDVLPSGPGNAGFIPYRAIDNDVDPGNGYRYYVEAEIVLEVGATTQTFISSSNIVSETAMIPIPTGSLISNASPNPFRDKVQISLTVPKTFEEATFGGSGVSIRVPTDVEVAVFDVRGRRIRELRNGGEFSEIVTVSWDGKTDGARQAPAGIYFLRVTSGDQTAMRKLVLLR